MKDADRILVTDSPDEIAQRVRDRGMRQFGLTYGPRAKRRWFMGE